MAKVSAKRFAFFIKKVLFFDKKGKAFVFVLIFYAKQANEQENRIGNRSELIYANHALR
ncbi:MAG: hypothetical protein FWC39_13340 [Bacteroidetes bacterium]|nr:hypothetical protein [Bacteroidota bacterium]